MTHALLRKLGSFCLFDPEGAALMASIAADRYTVQAHKDIIREGEIPRDIHLIVSGFAFATRCCRTAADRVSAYLLPGDFSDLRNDLHLGPYRAKAVALPD